MLTLKVITTNGNGETTTRVFTGDSISHVEKKDNNHQKHFMLNDIVVGTLDGSTSKQEYYYSLVTIYNKDGSYEGTVYVFPFSNCFIMENGRTVDSFTLEFIPIAEER
jgi:hypothetical protein